MKIEIAYHLPSEWIRDLDPNLLTLVYLDLNPSFLNKVKCGSKIYNACVGA